MTERELELVEALEAVLPFVPGWNDGDHAGRPWLDRAKALLEKVHRGQ